MSLHYFGKIMRPSGLPPSEVITPGAQAPEAEVCLPTFNSFELIIRIEVRNTQVLKLEQI